MSGQGLRTERDWQTVRRFLGRNEDTYRADPVTCSSEDADATWGPPVALTEEHIR